MAAIASSSVTPRPENVGILAMETYIPKRYVKQTDLEVADGCEGKYTKGLGQQKVAYVDDREDIGSIMLSAFSNLLEKYSLDPNSIGRIEVGTETLIDKSKSIKTTLMKLLGENTDVEGVSSTNACYGGTAAFLNSVAWVQSEDWDGRYAVVLCGDIAVYETGGAVCGSARATQGCGAIAILIGADAPVVLESRMRSSHVMDVYDFYKPHHSEYAEVDGACSQNCYLRSVDACFNGLKAKVSKSQSEEQLSIDSFDYFSFHSPYNKLVQKGFGRLLYCDLAANKSDSSLSDFEALSYEESLESKGLDAHLRKLAAEKFTNKMSASSATSIEVGNTYTGAVFLNLLSLLCNETDVTNKRIGMFSYGSGSVATLYSLKTRQTNNEFSTNRIREVVDLNGRLSARTATSVEDFSTAMNLRADRYGKCDYEPSGSIGNISQGAYYLASINNKHHRTYSRAV